MRNLTSKAAAILAVAAPALWCSQAQAQSGPYVGASVGYAFSHGEATTSTVFSPTGYFATTSVPAIATAGVQKVEPQAAAFGLDAGYDFHSGGFLYGIVADVSLLNGSDTRSTTATYPCCAPTTFTVNQTIRTKWMTTIRARVGLDLGDTGIYLTGGYAGLQARYSALFTDTFATAHEAGSKDEFRSGWVVGAGADLKIGHRWSLSPEFLHADFGHMNAVGGTLTAFTPAISFPTNVFTHRTSLRTNVARVALNYHFGVAPPPPPPAPATQTCPDGSVIDAAAVCPAPPPPPPPPPPPAQKGERG